MYNVLKEPEIIRWFLLLMNFLQLNSVMELRPYQITLENLIAKRLTEGVDCRKNIQEIIDKQKKKDKTSIWEKEKIREKNSKKKTAKNEYSNE